MSVNTVDRFQGQEKNIIIANLVRNWNSKDSHRMSTHITSFERINVAFSRAQNLLVVVGAQNLFSKVPVNLRAMDSADTRKLKVYSGIMSRLNQKGCFFPSSCLIDEPTAEKIKAEYKEANQNRGKKNYNNNKRFHKNNNREVKA
ncbi:AAA domain-containing protein [Treponema sp. OMZ 788]|uniref:AAA domain-containing protein n=1 Tax=Treponema sp. OMZ 788 TaxID=2563664 RepID=UPI0020A333B1